jgi:hypothetical protein
MKEGRKGGRKRMPDGASKVLIGGLFFCADVALAATFDRTQDHLYIINMHYYIYIYIYIHIYLYNIYIYFYIY